MGLDLSLVPDVVKPMALPLTGGAFPEADADGIIAEARTLEDLADTLAEIKAKDAGAVMRLLRDGLWQGAAKETFEQVFTALSGRQDTTGSPEALLDLLEQALRDEARALREHGVRMQHTEWMIYASLALLGAMIVRLLVWIYVNGPAVLRLVQYNTLLTKMNIQTLKRLVLLNMLRFGGIMGGLDLGVQGAQQIWGDREAGDFDLASLAMSAGSGALTGVLFAGANAGLSRLLSREMVYVGSKAELAVRDRLVALGQSIWGQALTGGVAGTAGAVPGLALSGQLDASHLAYTFVSGVAGGLDVPASARVSYTPMSAVGELGGSPSGRPDTTPTSGQPDVTTLAQHAPTSGQPDATPTSGRSDVTTLAQHTPPGATTQRQHVPPETTAPGRHAPAVRHGGADHAIGRPPPAEPGGGTLPPNRGGQTIAGEVVQRRDTLLPPAGAGRADGPAGPGGIPASRSPHPTADPPTTSHTVAAERPTSSTVPAERPSSPVLPAERAAGPAVPAERSGLGGVTERSAAGAGTPHDLPRASALPATVPAVTAVPHVTESSEQPTDQRDGAGPGPAKDVQDKAAEPPPRRDQVAPAVPDQRTSTASHTSPDRTVPPVVHGPAAAPEPQAVAELMGTPAARSRALPAGPGPAGSPPERVMRLLSQDGAYDPISVPAWNASDRAAVERLMDTMRSPTKDLLGAAGRSGLLRGIGDPGHLLVHTEYQAMGRTMRSWSAVERGDLPAFLRGSDGVIGERRVLRELPFDSPEALSTARRLAVEGLLKTWGYGAGELLPARMAMNMAALDEFGLTNVVDLQTYGDSSRARTAARSYARDGEVLRDFLRVQYAQTQHELSRHGIEELVLYRGVAFEAGRTIPVLAGAATGDVVTAPPALPLQSWSALTGVARRYTGLADGAVMAGVFPASRVLATPWTGMGQLPLHEFVLLAAPGEVTVQRPPHVSDTRGGSSHSDLPRGWRLRQDADSWTQCEQGHRHWGTEGAAGLLPFHRDLDGEVHFLLHLRSPDTHHGGTWGPVGGARHAGEQPVVTAFREGGEEVRLKRDDLTERAVHHDDHGGWAFDTVIVEARSRAEVWPGSTESIDTAWVPLRELESLNLHPDFARALPEIRSLVDRLPADSGTGPPASSAAPEAARPRPAAPEPPARERTAVAEAAAPEGTAVPRARAEAGEQRRVPMPAVPGARDTMLTDGYSAIADPRPRNFAEAAAIVHRWTPDGGGRHEAGRDGAPNRIERLLNGHGTDAVPPGRDPLEHGRDLIRQLPVENGGDAMAETLAAMSASLRAENPRRAICDLAMQLFGARQDVDALVALHQDAERRGLAPWAARDRADLADVLTRAMQQDHHRWLGYQHRALLPASTEAQARVAGLLVEMMGPLVTRSTVSAFTGPLLRSAGLQSVEQLLPLVRAAHDHGHLRQGTTGSDAFHTAMQGFRQMDPLLWDGLLVAEKYLLPGVGEQDARLLAFLQDVVAHPETGMGRRVVLPLERLADAVGQAGSVEQLVRLAGDARAHGADLARAPGVRELVDLLTAHRARDPHLWNGLRLAKEYGVARVGDAEARALARLAEITGPGPSSRIWVFDPLRRLADDAGLGPSVTELVRRAAEAGRDGFDLFGPVDRRQVLDALGPPGGRAPDPRAGVGQVVDALGPPRPGGGAPDPRAGVPGPHDLSPSAVREAREEAGRAHAQASHEYRRAHSPLRRSLSTIMGADPQRALERRLTSSLESRVQAWQRWPDVPEVSFTRDFGAFSDAYGRAVERGLQGEAVIPYLYDDATAALAARDGGRGFGLEIEFDLPGGVMTDDALAIPRALHEAGLTADATVHSYHSSKDRGYRSGAHGGRGLWRLEKDRSVIGELVSPILYDEPETWQNLRLACEIIRAHGGTATVRTGGHIHVSTHDYDHLVANYTSVLNYVGHHTDTLYRLGHNPENKGHRGQKWCHPSAPPAADYRSIADVQGLRGRETAVNTFGVTGEKADHVEFRMWDGSLDPAVIQSQVKVSLALVEAAFRNATLDTPPNGGRHDALGAHADLRRLGSAADTTEAGSLSFRLLMDEIFWRARDKEQLTALYAVTRWATADEQPQNGTPGR